MTRRITEDEVRAMYEENGTPERVIAHCRGVSYVAVKIGEALNKVGHSFDLELVRGAGLAHDVFRIRENHGEVCAEALCRMGYEDEAEIVKAHMYYQSFTDLSRLSECELVCLGDRLVQEDRYVGLDARFEYVINKLPRDEQFEAHRERILRNKAVIRALLSEIEAKIGLTIDELFAGDGNVSGRSYATLRVKESMDGLLKRVEKPGRYIGGEVNSVVKKEGEYDVSFAFAFPDLYEIGMSYLGMQILYHLVNERERLYCQRVFAPGPDMEQLLRDEDVRLMTLESKTPLCAVDVVGFTLQYEMSFSTILNMLDLGGIPVLAKDRSEAYPLVIAGGPCAFNPEPLADFIDLFIIGDGEEALPMVLECYGEAKKAGLSKAEFLKAACKLPCEGIYVPGLYDVTYGDDGTVKKICKLYDEAPLPVRRAIISEIESVDYPLNPLIPTVEAVHDRAVVETFRGCTRGCRFCQAGMIYRPVRERSGELILDMAEKIIANTGYDELSLLSLSTSDHTQFENFALKLAERLKAENVSLSLPSLRIDNFAFEVLNKIQEYKKSGLTYAPEAGTQHLRDVINKGVTDEDIYTSVRRALELGWKHIKLYFMIGLPGETDEDLDGIAEIARKIKDINYEVNGPKGGRFNLTVSVSNFVPKAHTPFQWAAQNTPAEFERKHAYLSDKLRIKGVTFNYHDSKTSAYEAIFARGDRRTGKALYLAFQLGCRLDGWTEHFRGDLWEQAFTESGVEGSFYTLRQRDLDEVLPWDIVDSSVSKGFLLSEWEKAAAAITTEDCRYGCAGCGINKRVKCQMEGAYVK